MNLKKLSLISAIAIGQLIPGHVLAEGRTSTGYLSSVTSRALVLDGTTYRLRHNQEEKESVEVQCAVKDKAIDCEELTQIDRRNRARAKVSFDGSGFVVRVQVLDVLK